ncbi:MAG TPA: SRPBCC family protein [Actinomycetota bacterium]|nr:SRPBCC family protein [Actinomycetota bacterium]
MNATVGKLNVELPEGRPEIVMTRTFEAARELVFKAHTSCEHMSHWWGPRSTSFKSCDVDFSEGGKWNIVLRDSDGNDAPFKGEFREIVEPERITWTFIYDVEPFNADEAVETIVFTEQDGKTLVTVTSVYPSIEARDGAAATGMADGAAETWDRLEEYASTLA